MNKFTKCILTVVLLMVSVAAWAQQPRRSPQERADHQVQWLQKHAGLTKEQNDRVYNIMLQHAVDMDRLKGMPRSRRKKYDRQQINRIKDNDLRATLNPEQYHIYKQHEKEQKEKKRERKMGWY